MFNIRKRSLESPEFIQLVACCRSAFRQNEGAPTPLLTRGIDWAALLGLARRHRVQGLVWRSLHTLRDRLPVRVAQSFSEEARAIARDGMESAAECARLLEAMSSSAVNVLFVKGLSLSKLAYDDPFVKMSTDIDILIDIEQLSLAEVQLRRLEYQRVIPAPGGGLARLERWHQSRKESVWRKSGANIYVELHTRLTDNRLLLPGMGATSARQVVTIAPGIALPTLAADELFAYLCVHGASSAWFRLKWLADLAALLERCSEERVSDLYRRSQELKAGRSGAQALLLAQAIFGTRVEHGLARELEAERANRWLARMPWREMTKVTEPTEVRFGTAMIHLTQFLLMPGVGFKLNEARRQLADAAINRS